MYLKIKACQLSLLSTELGISESNFEEFHLRCHFKEFWEILKNRVENAIKTQNIEYRGVFGTDGPKFYFDPLSARYNGI